MGELSLDVVKLLARHATQLRVVFLEHGLHIRVPNKLHLLSDEWEVLHRYVFTGNSSGCVADTIPFVDESWGDSDDPIELPGRSLGEITARWGIRPEPPCGYDGKALLFRSVCVEDPSKFSCRYPATKQLLGRRLTVVQKPERFSSYNLQHAMEAGVVPQHGSIVVDSKVERIFLPPGRVQIAKLKGPIEFRLESGRQRAGLLCPEPLVEHFLLSAAKAARTYRLPAGLTKYQVRTADPQTDDESDLPGTFYLMSDLKSLPHRGLRQERAERKERQERLVARFGPDLPADYEKYTDQELSQYFAVKELVARGEMIDITTHPALPRGGYTLPDFVDWIKTVKPDLVMSCPITRTQYLHSATVLGDLADLPGFWKAVERTVGLSSWLRNLILDPKVRAAAMAHAI